MFHVRFASEIIITAWPFSNYGSSSENEYAVRNFQTKNCKFHQSSRHEWTEITEWRNKTCGIVQRKHFQKITATITGTWLPKKETNTGLLHRDHSEKVRTLSVSGKQNQAMQRKVVGHTRPPTRLYERSEEEINSRTPIDELHETSVRLDCVKDIRKFLILRMPTARHGLGGIGGPVFKLPSSKIVVLFLSSPTTVLSPRSIARTFSPFHSARP